MSTDVNLIETGRQQASQIDAGRRMGRVDSNLALCGNGSCLVGSILIWPGSQETRG